MSQIERKICNLGEKRDSEDLQRFVADLTGDQLKKLIETNLSNANVINLLNYTLQGLPDNSESERKRYKVIETAIKGIEDCQTHINSSQCNSIVYRLCMELIKLKTDHLVDLCNFYLKSIQSHKGIHMTWKDVLPELLNTISERDTAEYNEMEVTGLDCKHHIIDSLCSLEWAPDIMTSLALMFIYINLTKEEHLQVVSKLSQCLNKLMPQEVPSFTYQLLRFSKFNSSKLIFGKLQNYFSTRVYDRLQDESENNSECSDLIEDGIDVEARDAEATVLFHIYTSASLGHDSVKDYIASLKNMLRSPEYILNPFQLSLLFTISTLPHYEEKIFTIIRGCVSRSYNEDQKKFNSAWFRDVSPKSVNIESVFAQVINLSSENRDLILQGLLNFGFLLLSVGSALGRDPIAEKQWQLGNMILFKIIKRRNHVAPIIIQTLSNHIVTGQNIIQFNECLYMMSKNLALLMLENKNLIITLMESLVQMPGNNANQVLDALIPPIKISPTLKDHFIILLRKALYSRITETRRMAVNGFLKLLTSLKISNAAAISQSSFSGSFYSGHSLFTQISMSRMSQNNSPSTYSNEALCLEILNILKRCFMQQAEVKNQLYDGLYNAYCLNPDLGSPILDMLWQHFIQFYNPDEEQLPPLKFDKITIVRDVTVTLQEPLGKLIYTISLIAAKVSQLDNENATISKLIDILNSLSERMCKCDLVHFELDDGTDLLDIMPESQQKLFVLKEAMNVYEALMGYKIFSWSLDTENYGKRVNSLFQGYCRLKQFCKNLSKPKKVEGKRKKSDVTMEEQTTSSNKKDGQKSKLTKLPDTVLDFQVIIKSLKLLYLPTVSWTTMSEANIVKTKREFYQHILNATFHIVSSLKHKKIIDVDRAKLIYGYLCEIASILYERIIKRMVECLEFDCGTAVVAADCFLVIFNLINNQYKSNMQSFLSHVGGKDKEQTIDIPLMEFVEVYQKLFEIDEDEITEDPEIKKLSIHVINTLQLFLNLTPTVSNPLSLQIIAWSKNYAINNTIKSRVVATSFINLLFDAHLKFKISLTLFENVSIYLGEKTGVITEEKQPVEQYKLITDQIAQNALLSLCNSLKSMLDDIDWIIARVQSEHSALGMVGGGNIDSRKESLKAKERGLCCQLCFIVTILYDLSNCTVPPGNLSEAILKNLTSLYTTLTSLTKHFSARSTKLNPVFQSARFEKLVRLAGKQLAPIVYKLIMYIEDSQRQETNNSQGKKKNVDTITLKNKVLKETRLIPKVVYGIEQFSKFIIQLSNKTKIDLARFVGQGTVRDFRILHLKEVLEQAGEAMPDTQSTEADETIDSEENENEEEVGSDESPPAKRSKN